MDLERVLVSKIVFTGEVNKVMARQIIEEHFADIECRDMYRYIVTHNRKYKSAPSLELAKHDRPDFEWLQTQDSLDAIIDRFVVLVKRRMADEYIDELARVSDDTDRAQNIDLEFLEASHKLIKELPTSSVERFSEVDKRIGSHERRSREGRVMGMSYGFPTLDRWTRGIRPYELVTVSAFTNVGKSTFLRALAFNFWVAEKTPLFISLEMEAEDLLETFDVMASGIDYAKLRQLDLSDEDMKKWRGLAEKIKNHPCDIPVIDDQYDVTPDIVYAEALRHKPDVVIVDYLGLMKSSKIQKGLSRYQQLADIVEDLKINARMLRIPIIVAAQSNRQAAKDGSQLDNTADSIAIVQHSDTVIGLFQNEEMIKEKRMEIRVTKNRKGPRGDFLAVWDHDKQEFRERVIQDMFGRASDDRPNEKPPSEVVDGWVNNKASGFARV